MSLKPTWYVQEFLDSQSYIVSPVSNLTAVLVSFLKITYMCICAMCVDAHRGQKRMLGPLELELQVTELPKVGAESGIWVLCKG